YARVRRLADGDDMYASKMVRHAEDRRDATHVKYDLLVDKNKGNRRLAPEFVVESFYGQLENIFLVELSAAARNDLDRSDEGPSGSPLILFLAGIRKCHTTFDPPISNPVYTESASTALSGYEVVDITTIQCLVGRTKRSVEPGGHPWAIIDRSTVLNRSYYVPDE
ncbi:hypothetical protein BD626DRAFT_417229, partial [Schizophyllum amplum]